MSGLSENISAFIWEAKRDRTKGGYKRVLSMCKKMKLSAEETNEIMYALDYHGEDGQPHSWLTKKKERR